jgi:aldehyde dehydrogenase (NAD+)
LTHICNNYIDGEWRPSESGQTMPRVNPARTSEIVGYTQRSTAADLEAAVQAAKRELAPWRKLSGPARGDYLFKAADILERRLSEIAETMTREMGKTLPEAKGETARGVALLRYYAGEGMRKTGDVIPSSDASALMYTTRVPLGVVGVITPWNFPVAIPLWKIAPALIYGNTVVFKPASEAAVTAAKVVECLHEAGLPAGVVNMVTGSGGVIGQALIEHPDIAGITFTGSEQTGRHIARIAAERGVKYQLEMGGKNPVIVAADADLDLAVEATISGAFRSTGQKCTATSRAFVQRGIYDAFKDKLVRRIRELAIGDGMEPGVWMGPCASEQQMRSVLDAIRLAKEEGAEVVCGGDRLTGEPHGEGLFVAPTVFEGVRPEMALAQEEIFGPVLALIPYDDLADAIRMANGVRYGLSASIFTRDIGAMLSFVDEIEAGLVRINAETAGVELQAPFGGMKASSSHSREQGQAAVEFFTEVKTVFVKP